VRICCVTYAYFTSTLLCQHVKSVNSTAHMPWLICWDWSVACMMLTTDQSQHISQSNVQSGWLTQHAHSLMATLDYAWHAILLVVHTQNSVYSAQACLT